MSFPRKRESIISDTYKFLDSRFRGNDNLLKLYQMNFRHATLPLYDLPEARMQTDALWKGFADAFRKVGLDSEPDSIPDSLFRGENCYDKTVFFGQVCGYPLTHEFAGRFQVIATPVYRTPYFTGPEYRSVIVVHRDCESEPYWDKLADAKGSLAVINSKNSHSGYNILRSMVTPLTIEASLTKPFFRKVLVSGGHRQSLLLISNKQADLAAIDGLTWSLLERYAPEDLESVRILELSPPAPAPAFVTDTEASDEKLGLFRKALQIVCEEPEFKTVREQLFLERIEILPEDAYESILEMEKESIENL